MVTANASYEHFFTVLFQGSRFPKVSPAVRMETLTSWPSSSSPGALEMVLPLSLPSTPATLPHLVDLVDLRALPSAVKPLLLP